jgi:aminoglycoside phosphotransferase (APT) family kinase protein
MSRLPGTVRVGDVRTPGGALWDRAVDVLRSHPPSYEGSFLHRDFHPGNMLFTGAGAELHVTGVVDRVATSWGPADLDVAHCSTALALLHGPEHGRHGRLLDALARSPRRGKARRATARAGPYRSDTGGAGRTAGGRMRSVCWSATSDPAVLRPPVPPVPRRPRWRRRGPRGR